MGQPERLFFWRPYPTITVEKVESVSVLNVDTVRRSVLKTVSWRLFSLLATVGLVWAATGKVALAVGVGGAEFLWKMVAYYVHERAWSRVGFGLRARHAELVAGGKEVGREAA